MSPLDFISSVQTKGLMLLIAVPDGKQMAHANI